MKGAVVIAIVMLVAVPVTHAQESGTEIEHCSPISENSTFSIGACVSDFLLEALNKLESIQLAFLTLLFSWIAKVVSWQTEVNNVVIFRAWEIARDMANIFFIVGLTLISFATIFRATGFKAIQNWHYRSALPRLLLAAILVNFSLGISDVVVQTTNKVTSVMTGIAENAGMSIQNSVNTNAIQLQKMELLNPDTSIVEQTESVATPFTIEQQQEVFEARVALGERAEEAFIRCQSEKASGNPTRDCAAEKAAALRGETVAGVSADTISNLSDSLEFDTLGVVASLGTNALFILINISIGVAVFFFLIRILALWIFSWLSAFAFGFMWINTELLKKWWEYFLGWNIFGPLYLFVIIFGMTFLSQKKELLASLAREPSSSLAYVEVLLFVTFAALIFIGGLMLVMNSSFKGVVASTPLLGSLAKRAGVFSATQLTGRFFGAAGRGARAGARAALTRPRTAFQARKEKTIQQLTQGVRKIYRPKSEEQFLAEARARRGVIGGVQQVASLMDKRVEGATKTLQGELNALPKDKREAHLRKRMNSRSADEAVAARNMLMAEGKLSGKQIGETRDKLPNELAQKNFDKLVDQSISANPQAVFDHKMAGVDTAKNPEKELEILQETFGKIMNNPKAIAKLGDEYFDSSKKEFANFKKVLENKYQGSKPKQLKQAEMRMVRQTNNKDRQRSIQDMFSGLQATGPQQAPKTTTRAVPQAGNTEETVQKALDAEKKNAMAKQDAGSRTYGENLTAEEIQDRLDVGGSDMNPEELAGMQRALKETRAREAIAESQKRAKQQRNTQQKTDSGVEEAKLRARLRGKQSATDERINNKLIDLKNQKRATQESS